MDGLARALFLSAASCTQIWSMQRATLVAVHALFVSPNGTRLRPRHERSASRGSHQKPVASRRTRRRGAARACMRPRRRRDRKCPHSTKMREANTRRSSRCRAKTTASYQATLPSPGRRRVVWRALPRARQRKHKTGSLRVGRSAPPRRQAPHQRLAAPYGHTRRSAPRGARAGWLAGRLCSRPGPASPGPAPEAAARVRGASGPLPAVVLGQRRAAHARQRGACAPGRAAGRR
jgi:hypothetical protein